jgi:hypothetical protein
MASIGYVAWSIASGASTGTKVDLGGTSRLVGISIHGTWTAAQVALKAYVPDSATASNPVNPLTDANAAWDYIVDDGGNFLRYGDGAKTSAQYIGLGMSSAAPMSLDGARYIQAVSVASGAKSTTVPTVQAQSQAVTGYFIVRFD